MTLEERQKEPGVLRQEKAKDFWDKLRAVGPLIVALAVSALGGWYGYKQVELQVKAQSFQREQEEKTRREQVFIELLSQRERSDNRLRGTMFNTLFDAYFGETITDTETSEIDPKQVKRQIMFLDILARNFETIDIKPLFEDLDEHLTRAIYDMSLPIEKRRCCFRQRERLRHVGRGALPAARQVPYAAWRE